MATDFDKVLEKLSELREEAKKQKKNLFNRSSHHERVIDELRSLHEDVTSLKTEGDKAKQERETLKKQRDVLERKRAEGYSHADGSAEHLERAGILDSWGGQALALVKLARKALEPPAS